MFTYDTFSFIQVNFVAFILLGLGAVLLSPARQRVPRRWASEPLTSSS
jgi:hypothetical protein